ncbi:hypothetical protein FHS43_000924 [Streptosporangium becharense]|uniref:Uncharacterized protein n=1 Tax=Streptosporangium becharense TaxID=1816182 RepID=A0A7W9IFH2_9ACTN|nr:hypothetical protein [Streptosporangium becharense]MBB2909678.1 hypothetical protein [Streptosporangium becharense]MBB5819366.1 hypothetical protein [Streptosporangium becharense]
MTVLTCHGFPGRVRRPPARTVHASAPAPPALIHAHTLAPPALIRLHATRTES